MRATFGEDGSKGRGAYLVEFWLALLPLLFWLLSMLAWYLRYLPKKSCSAAVKEGGLALYCQPTSNDVQKYLQLRRVLESDTVNVVNIEYIHRPCGRLLVTRGGGFHM